MKFTKTLLGLLLVSALLAGCGKTETAAPETTVAATEVTIVPTEAEVIETTEVYTETVAYTGVLEPYFKLNAGSYGHTTMEVVNDKTIRFFIMQQPMYQKAHVDKLAVGDTLILNEQEIVIEAFEVWGDREVDGVIAINPNTDNFVKLVPELLGFENNMKAADYYPTDANNNIYYTNPMPIDVPVVGLNFEYYDGNVLMEDGSTKKQNGFDLIKALRNNPERFTATNTTVFYDPNGYVCVDVFD